jgi:hypothetical protein
VYVPGATRDAVDAGVGRALESADDVAFRVAHRQQDGRGLLELLLAQRVPARGGRVAALLGDLRLLLLADLLAGLERLPEVVGEGRAEGRVGGGEVVVTLEALLPEAERAARDVPPGVADREQVGVLLERLGRDLAQRRVVVEDVEAPAEGRADEVVLARWITRSRNGMFGAPPVSLTHCSPPSTVKKTPNSVPAKSRSGLTWSCTMRQTRCRSGRSPAIDAQERPRSVLLST